MSRPTNTFRGARIAFDQAHELATQPDLFTDAPPTEFWLAIRSAAFDQMQECLAYEAARNWQPA
jgi:hypothetical protein